jgi:hypothetical protein
VFPVRQWLQLPGRQAQGARARSARATCVAGACQASCVAGRGRRRRRAHAGEQLRRAGARPGCCCASLRRLDIVDTGGFLTDLTAEMNAHIKREREPTASRGPGSPRSLLSEISAAAPTATRTSSTRRRTRCRCLCGAHVSHVMEPHPARRHTLREFWDGLPVKSDRVFKRAAADRGRAAGEGCAAHAGGARRQGTRVSNMVAMKLEALRQYGLHAAVPVKELDDPGDRPW